MFGFRNPVLTLAWGLPAVAVAASVASLVVALRTPESELPEQYHWEGFQLDRDFSQAARATELKVHATLSGFGASRRCELELRISQGAYGGQNSNERDSLRGQIESSESESAAGRPSIA